MLVKRLRQLVMLADGEAPVGLQGWQVTRLTTQARLFTIKQLLSMEKSLLTREFAIKTGASPFSLTEHIEQVLINM
jgi:hypothetical protein